MHTPGAPRDGCPIRRHPSGQDTSGVRRGTPGAWPAKGVATQSAGRGLCLPRPGRVVARSRPARRAAPVWPANQRRRVADYVACLGLWPAGNHIRLPPHRRRHRSPRAQPIKHALRIPARPCSSQAAHSLLLIRRGCQPPRRERRPHRPMKQRPARATGRAHDT